MTPVTVAMNYSCDTTGPTESDSEQQFGLVNIDIGNYQINILNLRVTFRVNRVGVSRLKLQSLCGDLSQHGSARSCPAFRKKSVTEKLEIVLNEIICRHYLQNVTADILQIHEDSCIFQCTDVIIITRKGNITISCKVSNCKSFIAAVLLVKFHFNIIHYRMKGQLNCNLLGYFNHIRYIRLSEYQAIRSKFIVLLR